MKLLVADDEPLARQMLKMSLTKAGYEVEAVTDGQEALDRLSTGEFNIVISDWEMPNLNGIELCRRIRQGVTDGYVYFIMVTQNDRPDDIVKGLEVGADDFLTKPFNPAELAVRVQAGERMLNLETRNMTIFALARLAESRDPETGAHLERVREYCRLLANRLAKDPNYGDIINPAYIARIYDTSPLHDIGKVRIPDAVLLKAGKLTDEEFTIMQTHTTAGADTIDAIRRQYPNAEFLNMAWDIAATHHERYNGKGYPEGISGDRIPLSGRILAVADVYDALTCRRCYKEPFSHEKTRSIILEENGEHFDPKVVQAFLDTEQMFIAVQKRFAEG